MTKYVYITLLGISASFFSASRALPQMPTHRVSEVAAIPEAQLVISRDYFGLAVSKLNKPQVITRSLKNGWELRSTVTPSLSLTTVRATGSTIVASFEGSAMGNGQCDRRMLHTCFSADSSIAGTVEIGSQNSSLILRVCPLEIRLNRLSAQTARGLNIDRLAYRNFDAIEAAAVARQEIELQIQPVLGRINSLLRLFSNAGARQVSFSDCHHGTPSDRFLGMRIGENVPGREFATLGDGSQFGVALNGSALTLVLNNLLSHLKTASSPDELATVYNKLDIEKVIITEIVERRIAFNVFSKGTLVNQSEIRIDSEDGKLFASLMIGPGDPEFERKLRERVDLKSQRRFRLDHLARYVANRTGFATELSNKLTVPAAIAKNGWLVIEVSAAKP